MAATPADPAPAPHRPTLAIGPEFVAVVLAGIAVGIVLFGIAAAGRQYLGWGLASAIVAVLVEPAVRWLDKRLPRVLAVVLAFLGIGAFVGLVLAGVLNDLGDQIERLQREAPRAAAQIEESERFGDVARDFDLVTRVTELVESLDAPTSQVGRQAVSSAPAYFLCFILTVSLLGTVPRLLRGAVDQISDPERRERVHDVVSAGFGRAQMYLVWNIGTALAFMLVSWGLFRLEGIPAPLALAVIVGAGSFVPGMGIVAGAVPALLLEAGLGTGVGTARLFVAVILLQLLHQQVLARWITPRTLVVGPAVIVIAFVLGGEVYGIGGAAYTAALAVFAVAALDVAGTLRTGGDTGDLVGTFVEGEGLNDDPPAAGDDDEPATTPAPSS